MLVLSPIVKRKKKYEINNEKLFILQCYLRKKESFSSHVVLSWMCFLDKLGWISDKRRDARVKWKREKEK